MIELPAAKALLDPLAKRLVDAHTDAVAAWAQLLENFSAFALPLDATTQKNVLHNHIWSGICRAFDEDPAARPNDKMSVKGLLIPGQIFLRFKYVGHGEPHNVATVQQAHIARQEYSDEMFDALVGDSTLGLPTFLTCGYTLDGPNIGRIEIRRDCKGHPPWAYDIHGGEGIVESRPFQGQEDDGKPTRVTKKIAAQGGEAADGKATS